MIHITIYLTYLKVMSQSYLHRLTDDVIFISVTLRKLYFHFLLNRMGYDRGDSFPFDFEPNGIPFG